jgi:hypothetical protein
MSHRLSVDPFDALKSGKAGGAYLESIGKTDLAKLTKEEWLNFLTLILEEYESLRIPF